MFKLFGVPVFEADIVAKSLVNSNNAIRKGLINLFGYEIYDSENLLDRKKLADLIFNDDKMLEKVNQLIYP